MSKKPILFHMQGLIDFQLRSTVKKTDDPSVEVAEKRQLRLIRKILRNSRKTSKFKMGVGIGAVQLSYGPLSDQILTCLFPNISGTNLQLLYGVRIELA